MPELPLLFYALLFVVAFLYASVGHGGASGYLALTAVFGLAPEWMRSSALVLNVFVSLIAFAQYYRSGNFRWNLFLALAAASVPASFAGGMITLHGAIYKQILGVLLLFPALRFIGWWPEKTTKNIEPSLAALLALGAVIGFLSGLIGIGGGILLSPVLLLLGWTDMKQTAGISALFIFVNSLAGIAGQWTQGIHLDPGAYPMVLIALAGGTLGAYLGARRWSTQLLKRVLGVVLLIAALKLLLT